MQLSRMRAPAISGVPLACAAAEGADTLPAVAQPTVKDPVTLTDDIRRGL